MKIPSFIRLPKNKRFNFEPRYYDPIKEELEERTSRIKVELEGEEASTYRDSISSAFRRKQRREKQSNVMQLAFVILLVGVFFGYLYYGNEIFYSLFLIIPFYLWLKSRRRS